jgi:hypothetical protein
MLVKIARVKCSSLFFLKVIDEEKKLNDIDIRGKVRWKGFPKSSSSKVTFFMHFFNRQMLKKWSFLPQVFKPSCHFIQMPFWNSGQATNVTKLESE